MSTGNCKILTCIKFSDHWPLAKIAKINVPLKLLGLRYISYSGILGMSGNNLLDIKYGKQLAWILL